MYRLWIALGSLAGMTGVGMAAYAAHGGLEPAALAIVRRGVEMQLWHALALVLCGVWAARAAGLAVHLAGAAFSLGLLGFCGALYLLALGGLHSAGMAPVGGTLLMAGWLLLGLSALRRA